MQVVIFNPTLSSRLGSTITQNASISTKRFTVVPNVGRPKIFAEPTKICTRSALYGAGLSVSGIIVSAHIRTTSSGFQVRTAVIHSFREFHVNDIAGLDGDFQPFFRRFTMALRFNFPKGSTRRFSHHAIICNLQHNITCFGSVCSEIAALIRPRNRAFPM